MRYARAFALTVFDVGPAYAKLITGYLFAGSKSCGFTTMANTRSRSSSPLATPGKPSENNSGRGMIGDVSALLKSSPISEVARRPDSAPIASTGRRLIVSIIQRVGASPSRLETVRAITGAFSANDPECIEGAAAADASGSRNSPSHCITPAGEPVRAQPSTRVWYAIGAVCRYTTPSFSSTPASSITPALRGATRRLNDPSALRNSTAQPRSAAGVPALPAGFSSPPVSATCCVSHTKPEPSFIHAKPSFGKLIHAGSVSRSSWIVLPVAGSTRSSNCSVCVRFITCTINDEPLGQYTRVKYGYAS